jgi:FkbM family methyltransferase
MQSKNLNLLGKIFDIEGVGSADTYFKNLSDNANSDLAKIIKAFLTPTSVALDIGANIGITSCMLSKQLTDGKVFSFEPSPSVFPILDRNLTTNSVQNVVAHQVAVGAQKGTAGFVGDSAYGHLVVSKENEQKPDGVDVAVETLDDIVETLQLDQLDFVKIDVEGFEDDVLRGGQKTEAAFAPLYFIELNAFCISAYRQMNPYDFAKRILTDFEYVFHVNRRGDLTRLAKNDAAHLLHKNIVEEGSVSNLLLTNSSERLNGKSESFI